MNIVDTSVTASDGGFIARTWPFSDFLIAPDLPLGGWPDGEARGVECLHFSGIAQVENRIFASAQDLSAELTAGRLSLPDVLKGIGFFTAVIRDGRDVVFINDLVGLEHFYVYEAPDGPIVSNRLHALAMHLEKTGIRRRPNLTYAATMLFSHHPLFRQCHAHGLAVEGLSLVPFDHYLVLSDGRLTSRRKPVLEKIFYGAEGSYSSLIDDAAEEIVRNVRVVRECGLFNSISVDLSGGRDSRIVFGAVLKLGLAPQTPVTIRDEPGTGDLKRALGMVEYFGAPLFQGDGHAEVALDERFALALWRSYFGGMYHKLKGEVWSAMGSNVGSLRLTGYCGEIYRSFWGNWFPAELNSERTWKDGLGSIFDRVVPDFPAKYRQSAVEAFAQTILDLPGESARQRLDNHYLFFRNRTHFGLRAFHTFNQFVRWPALVSPSLLQASRRLPEQEGRKGKAMFDVLDRIAPELNFFKYSGHRWPDEIARSSPNYERFKAIDPDSPDDAGRRRWLEAQAEIKRSANEQRQRAGRPFSPAAFKRHAHAETMRGVDTIRRDLPELASILGSDFRARTERLFEIDDEWNWRVATSKVASIVDIVLGGHHSR